MDAIAITRRTVQLLGALLLLAGCDGGSSTPPSAAIAPGSEATVAMQQDDGARIKAQVESALAGASDLPGNFTVAVDDGLVSISGALDCADCGGNNTPATIGSIQQTLGAIVRAVPGVERVKFELDYTN